MNSDFELSGVDYSYLHDITVPGPESTGSMLYLKSIHVLCPGKKKVICLITYTFICLCIVIFIDSEVAVFPGFMVLCPK